MQALNKSSRGGFQTEKPRRLIPLEYRPARPGLFRDSLIVRRTGLEVKKTPPIDPGGAVWRVQGAWAIERQSCSSCR